MSIKDWLYNYVVRKNGNVRQDYERYVMEHIEEHRANRIKHLALLSKLNWHYRIMRRKESFLYNDLTYGGKKVPPQPKPKSQKPRPKTGNHLSYPEMNKEKRPDPKELAERLLQYDVVSFDIFDTLILRYLKNPKDVFTLVGDRVRIMDYKTIRVRAENDARNYTLNPAGEVTIDEIYEILASYLGIDPSETAQIEFDLEKKVCYGNPYFLEVTRILKEKGKKVIAVSNMYWDSYHLSLLLKKCGYDCIDEVFVSCEYGVSKHKGELQRAVWEKIGSNNTVIHVGDNYNADYVGSRMIGWKAYYYKNVNEIGNEYRPAKMSPFISSLYGGIVNGHFHNGLNKESIFYELGFGYLGILIVGYCRWINEYATQNCIDKLLFTSRDMRLVYDIYNKYYNKIDSDYIKVSRFAALRFSYKRFSDYFIDSHIKARALISKLTIGDVLSELEITFMSEYLADYELDENDLFFMGNYEIFRRCLNEHKDRMLQEFRQEKEASIKYYSQFVSPEQKVAIIDLGWQGTNALCLKYLFEEEISSNIEAFSLLLASVSPREYVSNSFNFGVTDVYCFGGSKNEQLCRQFSGTRMGRFICELLFSSNEKSLKRIQFNDDGDFSFSYIENEKRNEEGIDEIYRGAKDFVEIWEKANLFDRGVCGFDAILPLNKISYNDICYEIMEGNEINPWIGETKSSAASDIRKIVR